MLIHIVLFIDKWPQWENCLIFFSSLKHAHFSRVQFNIMSILQAVRQQMCWGQVFVLKSRWYENNSSEGSTNGVKIESNRTKKKTANAKILCYSERKKKYSVWLTKVQCTERKANFAETKCASFILSWAVSRVLR